MLMIKESDWFKADTFLHVIRSYKDDLSVATLESFYVYLPWTNKTTYQAVHSNSCGQIFGFR